MGNKKPRKIGVSERRRPDLNRCVLVLQTIALPLGYCAIYYILFRKSYYVPDDSDGNRTRVTAVKGRCLNRLTMEPHATVASTAIVATMLVIT